MIKNIFLTGFMGSGKTTVGALLSEMIDFQFRDLDLLIESDQGLIVSEIFAQKGASFFRQKENELLLDICSGTNQVIALGGGTLMNFKNVSLVKKSGVLIWLDSSMDQVEYRIKKYETRPLYNDNRQILDSLFREREQGYQAADIRINNNGKVAAVPDLILNKIEEKYGFRF